MPDALIDFQGPADLATWLAANACSGALIRLFGILYSLYGIVPVTASVLFKLLDA